MPVSGYTKLFASILESTVWEASLPTKVVWITLLAMADRDGIVEASLPGLARRAGVSRKDCEDALALFLAPDTDSRTKEYEGRRIEPIDGGWRLLNHGKYRERSSMDDVRRKAAERVKRHRERKALHVTAVTPGNSIAEAEAHTEAEAKSDGAPVAPQPKPQERAEMVIRPSFQPLVDGREARRHAQHFGPGCDRGLCVDMSVHRDFICRLGSDDAELRLAAWYPTVLGKYAGRAVGDDRFEFWRNEFAAWIGTVTAKPSGFLTKGTMAKQAAERAIEIRANRAK